MEAPLETGNFSPEFPVTQASHLSLSAQRRRFQAVAWAKVSGRGGDPKWDDALRGGAARSATRLMIRIGSLSWARRGAEAAEKELFHGMRTVHALDLPDFAARAVCST